MSTLLPRDDDHSPIPALRLRGDGAHALAVGATSQRNAAAFAPTTRVIGLYATVPVYLRTGNATVTASTGDHYFPAGVLFHLALGDARRSQHSHIAALAADTTGLLYVSEME